MKTPTKMQLKVAGTVALIALVIVVIAQNTESVETTLLFVSVTMPRSVLLLITLLIGVALGFVLAMRVGIQPSEPEQAERERQEGG